jgi:hypothetical protein
MSDSRAGLAGTDPAVPGAGVGTRRPRCGLGACLRARPAGSIMVSGRLAVTPAARAGSPLITPQGHHDNRAAPVAFPPWGGRSDLGIRRAPEPGASRSAATVGAGHAPVDLQHLAGKIGPGVGLCGAPRGRRQPPAAGPGGAPAAQRGRATRRCGKTTATLGRGEGQGSRIAGKAAAPEGHLTSREKGRRNPLTQRGFRSARVFLGPLARR